MTVLIGVVLLSEIESDPEYFSTINEKINIEHSEAVEKGKNYSNNNIFYYY